MAEESLREVKARLQEAFLGRFGIHGMGIDPDRGVIVVYTHNDPRIDMTEILRILRSQSPYPVEVIHGAPLILM